MAYVRTDEIAVWNRAAMHGGGASPREGDRALSALLLVHGLVMNGGVMHALETVTEAELRSSCEGYRCFGFSNAAELLESAATVEWTDESDRRLNAAYYQLVDDEAIEVSFRKRMAANREIFAP